MPHHHNGYYKQLTQPCFRVLVATTLLVVTCGCASLGELASKAEHHLKNATGQKQWVIVLDAGHGGSDPGSVAANGLVEKELTLDIAKRASKFLSEFDDVTVVLTRDKDKGMSRSSRVAKVKSSEADVLVSLHFNHLPQRNVNLVESYYAAEENIRESQSLQLEAQGKPPLLKTNNKTDYGFTKDSKRLAHIMQSRVYNEVKLDNPLATNAGVKEDTLFVLTRSFTPGVLIELSCLSNAIEAENLEDENYRIRLAAALADGIRDYLHNEIPADTKPAI